VCTITPRSFAVGRHREEALFRALERRLMDCAEDRLVLDRSCHHGFAPLLLERPPGAEDGKVVGLGAARRETDLVRTCSETSADSLPGLVQRGARFATPPVGAGRISEARAVKRLHRLENFFAHRRRGRVVEVNRIC